jgi:aconitate hydratase
MEFHRNAERYRFLKWGAGVFDGLRIVPPGFGICHQVNLEFLARGVLERDGVLYPDRLVGTDSHTTMINGLGVVGWGVGGIEAEAAMLGQPVYLFLPDVVGVHLHGHLRDGVTATDLVLRIKELLRQAGVVGKFVEFHGAGAASLSVPDRATLGNMAPEYGATIGFFPVDEHTCRYLQATGRGDAHVELVRRYFQAQGLFGMPQREQCDYSSVIDLDLDEVEPSVAGPKSPQDRIALGSIKERFLSLLTSNDGYGKPDADVSRQVKVRLGDGKAPRPGGGQQSEETFPEGIDNDTSLLTEAEMMNNRPTSNRLGPASAMPAARAATSELAGMAPSAKTLLLKAWKDSAGPGARRVRCSAASRVACGNTSPGSEIGGSSRCARLCAPIASPTIVTGEAPRPRSAKLFSEVVPRSRPAHSSRSVGVAPA